MKPFVSKSALLLLSAYSLYILLWLFARSFGYRYLIDLRNIAFWYNSTLALGLFVLANMATILTVHITTLLAVYSISTGTMPRSDIIRRHWINVLVIYLIINIPPIKHYLRQLIYYKSIYVTDPGEGTEFLCTAFMDPATFWWIREARLGDFNMAYLLECLLILAAISLIRKQQKSSHHSDMERQMT